MTPQHPYKGKSIVTQGYHENAGGIYPEGHHGGLDIIPLDEKWVPYPAPVYPLFNGTTASVQNTDPKRGKGIKLRTECDKHFIDYLKSQKVVPKSHGGKVYIEVLYWHALKVLDLDGTLTQDTPCILTGNTGMVYSGGKPVPDHMKGVPPYPGLHLHFECVLKGDKIFNLDKDPRGRIDPNIILSYKGNGMNEYVKTINLDGEVAGYVPLRDDKDLDLFNKIFNKNLVRNPDGTIPTEIYANRKP